MGCGKTNHYFDSKQITDEQLWEELYLKIVSENNLWLDERPAPVANPENSKEEIFSYIEEKEETMWRCPEDKILLDLTTNCGFCGLGLGDFE